MAYISKFTGAQIDALLEASEAMQTSKEDVANKVTSINADADDIHYPSAKAVKDAIQAETTRATIAEQSNAQAIATKENLTNKVTSINADADDVHYPSAKAVWGATDSMVNGCDVIGNKTSLIYTSGSTYTAFDVDLPKGTKIRIWLDKVSGGKVGDECTLSVFCNTTADANTIVNRVSIILGEESSYIDCTTVADTTKLIVSGAKVSTNPWGTNITYAVVTHEDAKVPSKEEFNQLKKDIDSAHAAINAATLNNADDITNLKKAQVNLSEYISGEDSNGSIHHVIHEFNAEGRMSFNEVGTDNLNKWYIYDAAKICKTGVELKKFYVEYVKGNASVSIFVGVFAQTPSGFKLKYKLYSEDVKEHTGATSIPSETGPGYGNNSAEYQSVERYVLVKGDYIGFTPRNAWMCGYVEEKDGAYVLTDSGDGVNFTAAKTNIFCALKFDTTDVADIQVGELLTKGNAKKSVNTLPTLVNRAKRYNCTSDTKILLLGDSISSDTMMGGTVSEHNYNGFKIALSELLNIPQTNIILGGMPGLGVGWFSGDGAWEDNGSKAVIQCNPDIIISIIGANDSGSKWTVGTFSGEIDGEPIVKDLDFSTESSHDTYGSQGFTHFIQGVSWVVQRYLNTYYDVRTRAGVTDDDTVESATEKMSTIKIPKLIICTTLPQNRTNNSESSNPENWKRKRDAIVEVCNKYNIECVDLLSAMPWDPTKEPSFSSAEWKNKGIYTMDGLHPNLNGFRVIARLICAGAGLVKSTDSL